MGPLTLQNSEAMKKVLLKTPVLFCSQLKLNGTTLSSSELSVSLHPRKCTSFNDVQLLYDTVILVENWCHAAWGIHLTFAGIRLRFYGFLQVFPKTGQLIMQAPAAPPVSAPLERSIQEVSSGAGELSDSVSVGEVAVSSIRKKKMKVS